MSITIHAARITTLSINTIAFLAPHAMRTPLGMAPVVGQHNPSVTIVVSIYAGDDSHESLGTQEYSFVSQQVESVHGIHRGLPAYVDIFSNAQLDNVVTAVQAFVDQYQSVSSDSADEVSGLLGPSGYIRINRVLVNLPDTIADRYVQVLVGVYRDSDCTVPINDLGWVVGFVDDAFIRQRWGQDLTDTRTAEIRIDNNLFPLSAFLQSVVVDQALAAVSLRLYRTLKENVFSWADVDIDDIMTRHRATLATMLS